MTIVNNQVKLETGNLGRSARRKAPIQTIGRSRWDRVFDHPSIHIVPLNVAPQSDNVGQETSYNTAKERPYLERQRHHTRRPSMPMHKLEAQLALGRQTERRDGPRDSETVRRFAGLNQRGNTLREACTLPSLTPFPTFRVQSLDHFQSRPSHSSCPVTPQDLVLSV